MNCQFPKSRNLDEFWDNIKHGKECISFISREELEKPCIFDPFKKLHNFVPASAHLEDIDCFDADFFGIDPIFAKVMSPQHRLILESTWGAVEHAGYKPEDLHGQVGVYLGADDNTYAFNLVDNPELKKDNSSSLITKGNYLAYLSSWVSYKLNLTGPSFTVHSGCSSSLLATHLACNSLLLMECDVAISGSVAAKIPQKGWYLYEKGGIESDDGHCRPFDSKGKGTVYGNGVGALVLKRFEDAVNDGDTIHAIIKGSAVNNDGSGKWSFTAPNINSQETVISEALASADISAESIGYIEAHGTGTTLGDSIEIKAMTRAFQKHTSKRGYCIVGSVKSNVGHLEAAAGMAGLMKAICVLKHRMIPPLSYFESYNPEINFKSSPFYINKELIKWERTNEPRRAGVSSFGLGGSNAHLILEEAREKSPSASRYEDQLLVFSACSKSALKVAIDEFLVFLKTNHSRNLADMAYTLQIGRVAHSYRSMIVCKDIKDAIDQFSILEPNYSEVVKYQEIPKVLFLLGDSCKKNTRFLQNIYKKERAFREAVDYCSSFLLHNFSIDISCLMRLETKNKTNGKESSTHQYDQNLTISVADLLPYKFVIYYALSKLWYSWNVIPSAVAGDLVGEIVGACLAEVFDADSALILVAHLGQKLQAENQYGSSRPSTDKNTIQFKAEEKYRLLLESITLNKPIFNIYSCSLNRWITEDEIINKAYWISHLYGKVNNTDDKEFPINIEWIPLDVGACNILTSKKKVTSNEQFGLNAEKEILKTLGYLWSIGVEVGWEAYWQDETRLRVPLPIYPFERKIYWISNSKYSESKKAEVTVPNEDVLYFPLWKQTLPLSVLQSNNLQKSSYFWVILLDDGDLGEQFVLRLKEQDQSVISLCAGRKKSDNEDSYIIKPDLYEDYENVIKKHIQNLVKPCRIVHIVNLQDEKVQPSNRFGYIGAFNLMKVLSQSSVTKNIGFFLVTNNAFSVSSEEILDPNNASIIALFRTFTQYFSTAVCRHIDISTSAENKTKEFNKCKILSQLLLDEICVSSTNTTIAYRNRTRWVLSHTKKSKEYVALDCLKVKANGVYLIIDEEINTGLEFSEFLVLQEKVNIVYVVSANFPIQRDWQQWLDRYGIENDVSRKIERLIQINNTAESLYVVDRTSYFEISDLVKSIFERYGEINGVIKQITPNSADKIPIHEVQIGDLDSQIDSTVHEIVLLEETLCDKELDFCVLMSTLSSNLGESGFSASSSVSVYSDIFVQRMFNLGNNAWISLNYDNRSSWNSAIVNKASDKLELNEESILHRSICATGHFPKVIQTNRYYNVENNCFVHQLDLLDQWGDAKKAVVVSPERRVVPPYTGTEMKILKIWKDLLTVDNISIHDNFFEIGGDSLLITQVKTRVKSDFSIVIPLEVLFETPTVNKIAKTVDMILKAKANFTAKIHDDTIKEIVL